MAMTRAPKLAVDGILPEKTAAGAAFIQNGLEGRLEGTAGPMDTPTPSPKNATSQKSTGQTPPVEGNQAPQAAGKVVSKAEGWGEPKPGTYLLRIDSVTKAKINYVLDRMPGRLSMQKYIIGLIESDLKQQFQKLQ